MAQLHLHWAWNAISSVMPRMRNPQHHSDVWNVGNTSFQRQKVFMSKWSLFLTVKLNTLYLWLLLWWWWYSYTWNNNLCIFGISCLISDHVYDRVSAYFYIINGTYLRGFSPSEFGRTLSSCHVGSWVKRHWLILQSKQILQGVSWQNRCENSLFSNSHKWRPALKQMLWSSELE